MSTTTDDVLESWEEMQESGVLDRKLKALQLECLNQIPKVNRGVESNGRLIILGEDGVRSQYVPPKPTVKILKRPQGDSKSSPDGNIVNGEKPKQPIKSLKQREQEYAEARKRILGEERSPEEEPNHDINKIQSKLINQNGPNSQINVNNSYSSSSSSSNNSVSNGIPNNVIRMPIGPDGTRGFNLRR